MLQYHAIRQPIHIILGFSLWDIPGLTTVQAKAKESNEQVKPPKANDE